MTEPYLIDVHAHLQDEKFDGELESLVEAAEAAGVKKIINAATCVETSKQAVEIAEKFPACYATAGIHPHDASKFDNNSIKNLKQILQHPRVIAVGEIGLDFHYDFSPRPVQEKVFEQLWLLAVELKKPVVVHVREAFSSFFDILKGLPRCEKVLLHCFSGDKEVARKAADLGFHFSVGGALTFPKSDQTREVFSYLPAELIHLETDCPYLAPQPRRGKRNEPSLLVLTFDFLAALRQIESLKFKQQLQDNARNLFGSELF
ncbi:MAG: TatD family hydrolase [Candidatus Rifleibacteriota bacterium]